MELNPYEAPHEPDRQKAAEGKTDNRLLLAWDGVIVLLWLIALAAIARLFMPAV